MMPTDRFERQLPELLTELAEPRTPAYFDDLLGLTARTRQRPAWTLLERSFPMFEIARQPVHAPPIPWRSIGLLVLLGLALAAGRALIIGTLPRVPEPFGLARNGQIAFARDGDIFISDPATGTAHAVVLGPDHDLGPTFSHQGTQFLFLRQGSGPGDRLMVADADGSNVIVVAGSLVGVANISWSPDGSTIAFESSISGIPTITLAASDGAGARPLDLGMPVTAPAWRPPDGHQLVVRRTGATGDGLFIVDADGANPRELILNSEGVLNRAYDFIGSARSPDGTQLAFHDAFAKLVDGSLRRLGAAARLILRDSDLAQDAVQESLIRAWRDLPGLRDPDMAPPGKHVWSSFVAYAPYKLRESDWDAERQNLGDTVQATIESFFPGFSELVLHREVVTPLDIERTVGLGEGNIFAGEFLAPQMYFFRPAPGWSQYRTPIDGYYQCGSGTHPGGCVIGAPGKLAAQRILKDLAKD